LLPYKGGFKNINGTYVAYKKMCNMKKWLMLFFTLFLVVGCRRDYVPSVSDKAKEDLARSIDCSRAEEDIKTLEQEKAEASEQLKAGVKMFVPAAAARAMLHGDYRDRASVAIGEYNQAIDDKIMQIKQKCGI
jgi:hypothetical protein